MFAVDGQHVTVEESRDFLLINPIVPDCSRRGNTEIKWLVCALIMDQHRLETVTVNGIENKRCAG